MANFVNQPLYKKCHMSELKIEIVKRTVSGLVVRKEDGSQLPRTVSQPTPNERTFAIEKSSKKTLEIKYKREVKKFTVAQLKEMCREFDNQGDMEPVRMTKGLLILKELMTRKGSGFGSSSRGGRHWKRGGPRKAAFVELGKDRFVTSKFEKNQGTWNPLSDRAFKNDITETLNKLTEKNIREQVQKVAECLERPIWQPTEEEIRNEVGDKTDGFRPMTREERESFVMTRIIDKAVKEHAFNRIYANVVKALDVLRDRIVDFNQQKLYDFIANPSDNESDTLVATGHAKLMALLIDVSWKKYMDVLDVLIEKIEYDENPGSPPVVIEMFRDFVMTGGEIMCKTIQERADEHEFFRRFLDCMNREGIPSRILFMFVDVKEKVDEWLSGIAPSPTIEQEVRSDGQAVSQVRSAYSSYLETPGYPYSPETAECFRLCRIPALDFLTACMEIFPDQAGDHYSFCQFICFGLAEKRSSPVGCKRCLVTAAAGYRKGGVDLDCPDIWNNMADLMYLMIIKKIIDKADAIEVTKEFPSAAPWDWENGMKWFLYDYYDFHTAADVDRAWSLEVRNALQLPRKLMKSCGKIPLSKLIVVGSVRSMCELVAAKASASPDEFATWQNLIRDMVKNYGTIVEDELRFAIEQNAFAFSVNDVFQRCQVRLPSAHHA